MHYSLKLSPTRPLAIALAVFLIIFGASISKVSAQGGQCCNICSPCKGQHEAAEDRARAEKARMHGQHEAAEYLARANEAIQEANLKAAEYEAKANAHLEECAGAYICNTCAAVPCKYVR